MEKTSNVKINRNFSGTPGSTTGSSNTKKYGNTMFPYVSWLDGRNETKIEDMKKIIREMNVMMTTAQMAGCLFP